MAEPPVEDVVKEIVEEAVTHCLGPVSKSARSFWVKRYTATVKAARAKYPGQLDWAKDREHVLKRARRLGYWARTYEVLGEISFRAAYCASAKVERRCQVQRGNVKVLFKYCEGPALPPMPAGVLPCDAAPRRRR